MAEITNEFISEEVSSNTFQITAAAETCETIEDPQTMTVAECQVETQKHIENVRKYIRFIIDKIDLRGVKHDASKLESPEVELFAELTPRLANLTYGSEEYQASISIQVQ